MACIGTNVPRKDGPDKVAGRARYVDDLRFPNMLYGRTVRSSLPRCRIIDVRVAETPDLVIVDHRDIPGQNVIELIELDQPCLVEHEARHAAEPIVLLAHADRDTLFNVEVKLACEQEPAVLSLADATELQAELLIEKGDVAQGFAEADLILEGEYHTGHQEQL